MPDQTFLKPAKKPKGLGTPWRNRIVGSGEADPAQLVANPMNWRTHPSGQAKSLAAALGQVGWVAPATVNRTTGRLVDGHLRVEMAVSRGEPTIPVAYVDLSVEDERLVLASLDPIGAMATADKAKLEELLRDLTPSDDGLQALLDDLADKNGIRRLGLTEPDDLQPEPEQAEIYVRPGDLWVSGDHRLLCGDATDPDDVARVLDGAEPTLLSTDPPYGVSLDPTWRDGLQGPRAGDYSPSGINGQHDNNNATRAVPGAHERTVGHQNTTLLGDARVDWSEAFGLVPSLQVGYVWHAGVHAAAVADGLTRIGFEIVSQIIWDKGLFSLSRGWFHWGHEPAWVVRRPGSKVPFLGERDQSTIWRAPSPKMVMGGSTEEKLDHPTQKPVMLSEIPIRNHLQRGEAVYDPFLGSGTTLIAAERLGRRCYSMELDPKYAQIAIARWESFTGRKAVRDG
jgi:DNA modification methylase